MGAKIVKLEGEEIISLVKEMNSLEKERKELEEEFRLRSEALEKVHKERYEFVWKQIRVLAGFPPDQRNLEIDTEYTDLFGVAYIKVIEECQCPICKMRRGEGLDLPQMSEIRH